MVDGGETVSRTDHLVHGTITIYQNRNQHLSRYGLFEHISV